MLDLLMFDRFILFGISCCGRKLLGLGMMKRVLLFCLEKYRLLLKFDLILLIDC